MKADRYWKVADDTPRRGKETSEHDADGRPIPEPVSDTDARLAYGAVTRARHQLDLGGLSWIHDHHDGNPPAACS